MGYLQTLMNFLYRKFFCWHKWHRVPHRGLIMEPHLMRCEKCLEITGLNEKLTDRIEEKRDAE